MRAISQIVLVIGLMMIFGFCVYGFLATYELPGESFCRGMYSALILLSGVCVTQAVAPMVRRV